MPDATDDFEKIYFGIPDIRFGTVLEKEDYVLCKDLLYYTKVLEPVRILSQEVFSWRIRNWYALWM